MKRCPECRRDYYDDSLLYCLDDGSALLEGPASSDEPATAIFPDLDATDRLTQGKLPKGDDPLPPKPRTGGIRLWVPAVVASIVIVTGYLAYQYFYKPLSRQPISSIAVLPFEDQSGDANFDYLSRGISESLIYGLSKFHDLKVSPSSSVAQYKGTDANIATIAHELGVDSVLKGRLAQFGDNLTVSVELVDARNDRVIWGHQYDRKLLDLLSVQRDIANEIVRNLRLQTTSADRISLNKSYTENTEAYMLYLRGRYFWDKRNREANELAINSYNEAITLDPAYALAYAGLADCYLFPQSSEPLSVTISKARNFASRALELDDTLAEAHTTLAFVRMRFDYDWPGAEREFKRAIELDPKYPIAHQFYGVMLFATGRIEEGTKQVDRALELEPRSVAISWTKGMTLNFARRYDDSIVQLQKVLKMDQSYQLALSTLVNVCVQKGLFDEALATLVKLEAQNMDTKLSRAYVYALAGRRDEAARLLSEQKQRTERPPGFSVNAAKVETALGKKEDALRSLEQAYENRDFTVIFLKVEPAFDPLRDDPRFEELLKKVGLTS